MINGKSNKWQKNNKKIKWYYYENMQIIFCSEHHSLRFIYPNGWFQLIHIKLAKLEWFINIIIISWDREFAMFCLLP